MWFGVLGPLEVRDADGGAVAVGGSRARALLTMLVLDAGRVVPVERLIDGQYGGAPPAGAANAVQAQVSRLRRVLPPDLLTYDGTGYRLAADPSEVDAHEFERLAANGRRLLADGDPAAAVEPLAAALALWRGPALADLTADPAEGDAAAAYGGAGGGVAARLEELRLVAAEDLAEARLAAGDGRAVADLRHLVAAHPLRERPVGLLMRGLRAEGRRAEALAVYETTRRVLADELGTDPSPELAAVHLDVLRDDPPGDDRPRGSGGGGGAADHAGAAPVAPPAQLTSFLGRADELARVATLTAPDGPRLITVLGPGGIGKTRLVTEAASRTTREACFTDLAPLDRAEAGGAEVAQAVLGALGVRDGGYRRVPVPPGERLVSALAGRDLLLVLDNCEHVLDAAANLARTLLAACPGLRVLATSREPLGITGETLVPLAPLPLPADPPESAGADALASPAVRLFADRAAAVRPGFAVDASNVGTVVRVCAALDGLPLAIELAAARLRTYTVDDLAARLAEDDRFALLSRGDRTAAARHRTLRAVVEWSWAPLTPDEQALARRFAVFTGGATGEAVEAVCGGDPDVLADLVDRSLVETDGRRYRMLSTIRLFCAEKLAASGEEERVRAAHAAYFLDLARRADPHLRRAEQLDWLAALSADHGNLLGALRWARDGDPDTGLRLIAAMAAYLWLSGHRADVGPAAAALLDHARASLGAGGRTEPGLAEEYLMCVVHAVPRAAPEHWARGRETVLALDGPRRYPFAVALWGMAAGPPGAESRYGDRIFGPDPWNRALIRLSNALVTWFDGVPAETGPEFEAVLSEFRELGERWGMAQCLDWLAVLASWRGAWAAAEAQWADALTMLSELGAAEETVDVLVRRAECRTRAAADDDDGPGLLEAAAADLRRAGELSRAAGHPGTPAAVDMALGELARFRGDPGEARRRYDAAASGADDDWGADSLRADIELARGHLAEADGDPAAARAHYARAVPAAALFTPADTLATAADAHAATALLATADPTSTTARTAATAAPATADPGNADPATAEPAPTGPGERAAFWLGVAVAVRGTEIAGDRDTARIAAAVRARIGDAAYARAHARGAGLSRDAAVDALASADTR